MTVYRLHHFPESGNSYNGRINAYNTKEQFEILR
jgi:hypothetical protein